MLDIGCEKVLLRTLSKYMQKRKGVGPEDAFYASAGTLNGDQFSELVSKSAP